MNKLCFSVVEPRSETIPQPTETKGIGGARYVRYGEDNNYPNYLLDCYEQCATLQSIINGTSDYIAGAGFVGDAEMIVNEKGETYAYVVGKAVVDYLIYGAFSIGVRRNKNKEIRYLDYHDVRCIRLSEDGETAFYCKDWTKAAKNIVTIPVYKRNDVAADRYELYYKHPASRGVYGRPMWASCTKDVRTSIEISTFHLSSIINNFVPSAIVNFNNGQPDEETQKDIEKRLNDKFSGATKAARLLVAWNDTKDHAVDIQRLSEDNFDQRYQALAKSTKENIFIAFRAHPQLFGADPERTGFNSVEYQQTFQLFKRTVVEPLQTQIEGAFATLGDRFRFTFNEFTITFTAEEGEEV